MAPSSQKKRKVSSKRRPVEEDGGRSESGANDGEGHGGDNNDSSSDSGDDDVDGEGDEENGNGRKRVALQHDEAFVSKCAEYVELNAEIKETGARVTVMRKNLKTLEKALLEIMHATKLEDIVVDGVKISRIKKLQIIDQ